MKKSAEFAAFILIFALISGLFACSEETGQERFYLYENELTEALGIGISMPDIADRNGSVLLIRERERDSDTNWKYTFFDLKTSRLTSTPRLSMKNR